jgi:hypothetical protein
MWLVALVFVGIPLAYIVSYGITTTQAAIHGTAVVALLIGYLAIRTLCVARPVFVLRLDTLAGEQVLKKLAIAMLLVMAAATIPALNAMRSLGDDYRILFFVEQGDIFGFDRFGFFLQIFTEYLAIPLFALALGHGRDRGWRICLILWAVLGTTITLGRWYAFFALALFVLSTDGNLGSRGKFRILLYCAGAAAAAVGGAILFTCRGEECEISGDLIVHGLTAGVAHYLYLPIEMVDAYKSTNAFSPNLFVGFIVYPFDLIGRFTGLYSVTYEYDKWGLLIQDYVHLPNIGSYNALVGQPLTSWVAAGLPGVALHYLVLGGLLGVRYQNSSIRHPLSTASGVTALASFFIPSLSGPMWLCTLVFYALLSTIAGRSWKRRSLASA